MEHDEAEYHDICPVCFWENDPVQNENENFAGGANEICLSDAKKNFSSFGAVVEDMVKYVREPFESEK